MSRWQDQANCHGLDPNLFYPERGDNEAVAKAKAVCAGCQVLEPCLDEAFGEDDHYPVGIRGGMTGRARTIERRRRRRLRQERVDAC